MGKITKRRDCINMENSYYNFIYELIRFNPRISAQSIAYKLLNYLSELEEEILPNGFDPLENYRINEIEEIRMECAAIE